jgi:hypothetical protein
VLKFDWNTLRIGDRVLVHDQRRVELTAIPGEVALVDSHYGVNGVGIRVALAGSTDVKVLWPSYLAVHRDPRDTTEPCWRCEEPAAVGRPA